MRHRTRWGAGAVALSLLLICLPAGAGAEPASPSAESFVETRAAPVSAGAASESADLDFDALLEEEFDLAHGEAPNDPFEPVNRGLLKFNQLVDRLLFDPLTKTYRFFVPEPARRSIRRAFVNLNAPVVLVNDLLQLRFRDAAETLGCFVLNSTVGMAGLFDAGKEAGWKMRHADFGQTLAKIGVGAGPYLVLPILGPSTLRDGFGEVVDQVMHPLTYLVGPGQMIMFGGGSGFTMLDAHADALDALEEASIDYYAALRSVYLQNRHAQIWGEDEYEPADSAIFGSR